MFTQLHKADCLDFMRSLPDDYVDIAFADPPFNLGKKYLSYKDKISFNNYLEWSRQWLTELVRVTKPTGSIFIHNIPQWLRFYNTYLDEVATFKHWIAWQAPSGPMGKSLQPTHYGILYYAKDLTQNKFYELRSPHQRCRKCRYLIKDYGGKKKQLHPFGPLLGDVWTDIHRIRHSKQRDDHPCQLPISLLERLILMASDENDLILDVFTGTGTTAVAAKRLGRNFIGCDLDYIKLAEQNVSRETFLSKIGNSYVSFYGKNILTLRDKNWPAISPYFSIPQQLETLDNQCICLNQSAIVENLHFDFLASG